MKIKHLIRIQSEVEKKAVPNDLESLLNLTYYSKSKMQIINIGDMHLTHFVRVFAKMLESKDSHDSSIQLFEIKKMKERLDEIEKERLDELEKKYEDEIEKDIENEHNQ